MAKTRPARVFKDDKTKRFYIKVSGKRIYLDKKLDNEESAIKKSIKKYRITPRKRRVRSARSATSPNLPTIEGFSKKNTDSNIKISAMFQDPTLKALAENALSKEDLALNKARADTALYLEKQKLNEADAEKKKRDELAAKERKIEEENNRLAAIKIQIAQDEADKKLEEEEEKKAIAGQPGFIGAFIGGYPTNINGIPFTKKSYSAEQIEVLKIKVAELLRKNEADLRHIFSKNYKKIPYDDTKTTRQNIETLINKADKRDLVGKGKTNKETDETEDKTDNKTDDKFNSIPTEKQIRKNGLYSDQIAEMMKDYNGFIGVVAADEVGDLANDSLNYDRFGFVMNKDTSDGQGSHWVACFCDLDDASLEYYDSFAEEPEDLFLEQIKKLLDKHDLDYYLKMKINRIKNQRENSSLCGFHAMRFLIDRFNNKDWKFSTGYSEVSDGEKAANNLMKKYERFGYI